MYKFLILFLIIATTCNAQVSNKNNLKKENYYLEDQLYIGVTYNILTDLPSSISQTGFSNGFLVGYIKDLPINKKRNYGFGIGLGYALDTYFQDLKIFENNNTIFYENFEADENFESNKIILNSIELPFEIRFRTSTRDKYKFWRIYTGIKFKYIFSSKASFKDNGTQKTKNLDALNNFNYGLTLGAGHGTWNLHLYYGLKPIFKDAFLNDEQQIKMKDLKIGLIFYIL